MCASATSATSRGWLVRSATQSRNVERHRAIKLAPAPLDDAKRQVLVVMAGSTNEMSLVHIGVLSQRRGHPRSRAGGPASGPSSNASLRLPCSSGGEAGGEETHTPLDDLGTLATGGCFAPKSGLVMLTSSFVDPMYGPAVRRKRFSQSGGSGLASMYPAFDWSVCCPWPSWISARVRSH